MKFVAFRFHQVTLVLGLLNSMAHQTADGSDYVPQESSLFFLDGMLSCPLTLF